MKSRLLHGMPEKPGSVPESGPKGEIQAPESEPLPDNVVLLPIQAPTAIPENIRVLDDLIDGVMAKGFTGGKADLIAAINVLREATLNMNELNAQLRAKLGVH